MDIVHHDIPASAYLKEWNLTLVENLPARKQTQVLRVRMQDGRLAILKLYRDQDMGIEDEAPLVLEACKGEGCVELYASRPGAMLMEWQDGRDLANVMSSAKDLRVADGLATDIVIDIGLALRTRAASVQPTKDMANRLAGLLYAEMDRHPVLQTREFQRAQNVARRLIDTEVKDRRGLLHGDLHPENIIEGSRGWRAIDPIGVLGEPEAEYAMIFRSPPSLVSLMHSPDRALRTAKRISDRTGLDPTRILGWAVARSGHSLWMAIRNHPQATSRHENETIVMHALLRALGQVSPAWSKLD